VNINNTPLRSFRSIFVIAEIASAHNGEVGMAKKMADAVRMTGADAVKYQMFRADELLVPAHSKYRKLKEIEFPQDDWAEIVHYARALGLLVIAEIFDEGSFKLALELGIDVFKIPSSDLTNPNILSSVAEAMQPVILSVGAATAGEIDFAVKTCEGSGNRNLILMHGFQSFPTRMEDTNFRLLELLKCRYQYNIGFADHIDAESDLARFLPLVAIGYGASVIEKHITLDRSLKGRDYYSALNPDEFSEMVSSVREIEKGYGSHEIGASPAEIEYRRLMKKTVVASHDISKGCCIGADDICFRRAGEEGLAPNECSKLMKRARRSIRKYAVIRETDVY
jgi:N,N'-diacetyllegionaminate synthase